MITMIIIIIIIIIIIMTMILILNIADIVAEVAATDARGQSVRALRARVAGHVLVADKWGSTLMGPLQK